MSLRYVLPCEYSVQDQGEDDSRVLSSARPPHQVFQATLLTTASCLPLQTCLTLVFPGALTTFSVLVAKSCLTLCDPMDCSPPGFSVHGIFQARILEWTAICFSRDLPYPGIKPMSLTSPAMAGGFFTIWTIREAHHLLSICVGLNSWPIGNFEWHTLLTWGIIYICICCSLFVSFMSSRM